MSDAIAVGDWVVGGTTRDTLDWGRIVRLDSLEHADVAWEASQVRTPCDLTPDDVAVYGDRDEAEADFERRWAEA